MYKNIMEKNHWITLLISIGLFFICLCFSVLFINIFIYLYIFLIIFFLFNVILPVFFCEIIQSHLLYVRCPEGFTLFSFFLFFFFGRGGGGGCGRTDGPI